MAKRMHYPHRVETDQGETVVKLVPARKALKEHLCPDCDKYTELLEEHILLLPIRFPGNRRYFHKGCYERMRHSGDSIILHPNLPYLSPEYG